MTKPTFFYSVFCPVCMDVINQLKKEKIDLSKRAKIINCDTKKGSELAKKNKIQYVPSLISNGKMYEGEEIVEKLKK